MKNNLKRFLACTAFTIIMILVAGCNHSQSPEKQTGKSTVAAVQEDPGKLVITGIDMDDPLKLYVIEQDKVQPKIRIKMRNEHKDDLTGEVKITIDTRNKNNAIEKKYEFSIPGEKSDFKEFILPALTQADYYTLNVQVINKNEPVTKKSIGFGVVRKAAKGIRENSPFGLYIENAGTRDEDVSIAEKMGVKWIRGISDKVDPPIVWPEKDGMLWDDPKNEAGLKTIQEVRDRIKYLNAHGITPLGYINYNMDWNVEPIPGKSKYGRHENRPADLNAQVKMVYHTIAPLQDLVKNWEIWNEPWIHGWTWATGDAEDYRQMSKKIYTSVKADYPDVNIIGGGSVTYNRDIVYAKNTPDTGYIDGSVSHAYGVPDAGQLGLVETQKKMDEKWSVTKGKAGLWQTELGTSEKDMFSSLPEAERKWAVAKTIAPTYLLQMLGARDTPVHIFWYSFSTKGKDSFNIYDTASKSPKPAVLAYSAMTYFLEDSRMVKDMYPKSKAVWGFLFEKENGSASAALYLDRNYSGRITLEHAKGIKMYDYLGAEIIDGSLDTVSVDLKPWETVYVVSEKTADELGKILESADLAMENALKISPLSFTCPVSQANSIDVKIENVTNKAISGYLSITPPDGWSLSAARQLVSLAPGKIENYSFPVTEKFMSDINRYNIKYVFEYSDGRRLEGDQAIQAAYAPYKSIAIDGNMNDWEDIEEVTMISEGNPDYLDSVLNPNKVKEQIENGGEADNVIYTVKTAWDDKNFYFMAKVPDYQHAANLPFDEDNYAFPFDADSIQLAFDCINKNSDDLLLGNSHYEKATATDMDYLFAATLAKGDISELYRLCAPGTNYQTYYPTNGSVNPAIGVMNSSRSGGTEGRVKIIRDEKQKVTTYEIAVSWKALKELSTQVKKITDGGNVKTNFAFCISDKGEKAKWTSYWTKEAGQVESGVYAFAPFWKTGWLDTGGRIITRWGFVK